MRAKLLPLLLAAIVGCDGAPQVAEVASDDLPWMTVLAAGFLEQVPEWVEPRDEPLIYVSVSPGLEEHKAAMLLLPDAIAATELPGVRDSLFAHDLARYAVPVSEFPLGYFTERGMRRLEYPDLPRWPMKWALHLDAVTGDSESRKSAVFMLAGAMYRAEVSAQRDGGRWVLDRADQSRLDYLH